MRRGLLPLLLIALACLGLTSGAGAQSCPQHLTPELAGWLPPTVCAGQGRYIQPTPNEVKAERGLFQSCNYGCDLLVCRRTGSHPPTCAANALAAYTTFTTGLSGTPPCLDTAAAAAVVFAFLDASVFPVLYCDGATNSLAQNNVSKAVANFFDCVSKAHLERAIDENSVAATQALEQACADQYAVKVADMGTSGPACLSLQAALDLGGVLRTWMDAQSVLAFCAY